MRPSPRKADHRRLCAEATEWHLANHRLGPARQRSSRVMRASCRVMASTVRKSGQGCPLAGESDRVSGRARWVLDTEQGHRHHGQLSGVSLLTDEVQEVDVGLVRNKIQSVDRRPVIHEKSCTSVMPGSASPRLVHSGQYCGISDSASARMSS